MKFFAVLSFLFYTKVVAIYLILGHSHNSVDRIVAWCHNVMKGKNFFTPMAIIDVINKIKGMNRMFIGHFDSNWPCFTCWDPILNKYFKSLPPYYTLNYFFEIEQGHLNMRLLTSSPSSSAIDVPLIHPNNINITQQLILSNLCGTCVITIKQAMWLPIRLPITHVISLSNKKLSSHSKEYFSISPQNLPYYLAIPVVLQSQSEDHQIDKVQPPTMCWNKRHRVAVDAMAEFAVAPTKARPGHPKKAKTPITSSQKSI